jgi:hypothetical protein
VYFQSTTERSKKVSHTAFHSRESEQLILFSMSVSSDKYTSKYVGEVDISIGVDL